MSDFQYVTKDKSSSHGKPKVFFTSHPDDFKEYSYDIEQDIFSRVDCAMFYFKGDEKETVDKDYEFAVSQMQLLVIPVTTSLLLKPCRTMDVDVPLARKYNVPILPLIQEPRLTELFNNKFGELQFLDKTNDDPTAISYDDKLTGFLNAVLIGDELAAKVRAAFDAYIFMSYRKKDREHAHELMKLIHKNPLCRDIAIWYDEFLIPGENFNEAIEEALKKCDLFALTVTPNLVNEINYVSTKEYPQAKALNKDILPVEMIATDKSLLKQQFADIPQPINSEELKELDSKLAEIFRNVALCEADKNPQHTFFIGLAYLNGIDVEVDREKAVGLITSAAKSGYAEGLEMLVTMFRRGDGVQRDDKAAAFWYEKLVDIRRDAYLQDPKKSSAETYISSLSELAEMYYDASQFDDSERICNEILSKGGELSEQHPNSASFSKAMARACYTLGDRFFMDDKREKSFDYFRKGIDVQTKAVQHRGSLSAKAELASGYERLAHTAVLSEEYKIAKDAAIQSIDIAESLGALDVNKIKRKILCEAYNTYVSVLLHANKSDEALLYSHKAIKISKSGIFKKKSDEDLRLLAMSYLMAADSCFAKSDENPNHFVKYCEKAEKLYKKSYKLFYDIRVRTETLAARRDLGTCLIHFGKLYSAMGYDESFVGTFLPGVAQKERLFEETNTIEDCCELIDTYILFAKGDILEYKLETHPTVIEHAEQILKEALNCGLSFIKEKSSQRVRNKIIEVYDCLDEVYEILKDETQRTENLREVIGFLNPDGSKKENLAYFNSCETLAGLYMEEDKYDEAQNILQIVCSKKEKYYRENPTSKNLSQYAFYIKMLGESEYNGESYDKAEEYYLLNLKIIKELRDMNADEVSLYKLSNAYGSLGELYLKTDGPEKAEEYYVTSLRYSDEFAKSSDDPFSYDNHARHLYTYGETFRHPEALQQSIDILDLMLEKKYGNENNLQNRRAHTVEVLENMKQSH